MDALRAGNHTAAVYSAATGLNTSALARVLGELSPAGAAHRGLVSVSAFVLFSNLSREAALAVRLNEELVADAVLGVLHSYLPHEQLVLRRT